MIPKPKPRAREEIAGVARGLITLPTLALHWSALPRGEGRPVLVIPGFMTGDASTLVLRRLLRGLGWRVYGWGLGRNHGRLGELLPRTFERIDALSDRHGPLRLVGWSLGGVIARESARERPGAIAKIVTLGTPVIGGPKYTAAAERFARGGAVDLDAMERRVAERNAQPLGVPITALYSRRDGIVSWQACIDPNPENATEHVEVDLAHSELGVSPTALRIIARSLV